MKKALAFGALSLCLMMTPAASQVCRNTAKTYSEAGASCARACKEKGTEWCGVENCAAKVRECKASGGKWVTHACDLRLKPV